MFSWPALRQGQTHWVVTNYAGWQLGLNEGALFGLGQGAQFWFALLSVGAALAIPLWLFALGAGRDWWMIVTLGGVMGGVLGNLYDRVGLPGLIWGEDWPLRPHHQHGDSIYAVRDWILLQWSDDMTWPNFNIADSLLVVGATLLFIRAWKQPAPASAPQTADASGGQRRSDS